MTLTLHQALNRQPWHFLRRLARRHNQAVSSSIAKARLVEQLDHLLSQPAYIRQQVDHLPQPASQALKALVTAGGQLPVRHLVQHFGPLRSPSALAALPAATPLSTLETLLFSGLVAYDRQAETVFLPTEILTVLRSRALTEPQPPLPAGQAPATATVDPAGTLLHDLTCLLALLQRQAVRPLHGRWLPPSFLERWGELVRIAPENSAPRSERQTHRRRFLHYLAENAGQLSTFSGQPSARNLNPQSPTPNPHSLLPTPQTWSWLKAKPAAQLQVLWHSWASPDLDRWRAFRLPGYEWLPDPGRLVRAIHDGLVEQGSWGEGGQGEGAGG